MGNRIEAADYRELSRVGEPHVHPAGDRVAYVRTEPDGDAAYQSSIHVVKVADGADRQYTQSEGRDHQPRFSPSGDRLAFVSARGEDTASPQLWVLPTSGGEARQVTDVVGPVQDICWSPDGARIAFTQVVSRADREEGRDRSLPAGFEPQTPDPRVTDRTVYRSLGGYFDQKRPQVYVVDLTAEANPVDAITDWDAHRGFQRPEWGDATTLYYTTTPDDVHDADDTLEFTLVEYDLKTGTATELHRSSGFTNPLAATADGRIAFPYLPDDDATLQQKELHVYDSRTDTVHVPTESLDRTVGGFISWSAEWGPDDEYLYFATPDEGSFLIRRVPWDGSEPPAVVTGRGQRVSEFSVGDGVLATTPTEPAHPGDLFAIPLDRASDDATADTPTSVGDETARGTGEDASARRLTRVNEAYLESHDLATPTEVWFEGPSGDDLQGWLLLPPDDTPAAGQDEDPDQVQFPVVVEVHGGPYAAWTISAGWWWHQFQVLAGRGYAVFWMNPRGSTGYGEAFMASIEGAWGEVTLADIEAGLDHVTQRDDIDETQQFVSGYSFGGYMAGWSVGNTDRFTAAVGEAGIYDLASYYGSSDAYRGIEEAFGTTPWDGHDVLHEHSPVAHADDVDTPTLLLHSENDYRTPINTAEYFYRVLRRNDVDTRLVRYPREGHQMVRHGEPAHVIDRIERIARWFDGYCDHTDSPPALDRHPNAGLSGGDTPDGGADAVGSEEGEYDE